MARVSLASSIKIKFLRLGWTQPTVPPRSTCPAISQTPTRRKRTRRQRQPVDMHTPIACPNYTSVGGCGGGRRHQPNSALTILLRQSSLIPSFLLILILSTTLIPHTDASPLEEGPISESDDSIALQQQQQQQQQINPFLPSPELQAARKRNTDDPRRIMCGYQLIVNLKLQCGDRGTFSPYERGPRVRRGLRLGKPPSISLYSMFT